MSDPWAVCSSNGGLRITGMRGGRRVNFSSHEPPLMAELCRYALNRNQEGGLTVCCLMRPSELNVKSISGGLL